MTDRRMILLGAAPAILSAALAGCSSGEGKEVGAVEDLMREYGVLRRIILALTAYRLDATSRDIATANVTALSWAFDSFELMYDNQIARDDTSIFPAWTATLSDSEIGEMGEKFEDIEKQEFRNRWI